MAVTLVVAADWFDYRDWCRDNGRHPHGHGTVYVSSPSRMRGYRGHTELVITPGGADREDLPAIREQMAFIEATTAAH